MRTETQTTSGAQDTQKVKQAASGKRQASGKQGKGQSDTKFPGPIVAFPGFFLATAQR